MKLFAPASIFFLLCITACGDGSTTTSTDSTTVTTGSTQAATDAMPASTNINVNLDPSASYVDLKTGKSVKLRVDTVTRYIVDESTNEPVTYYVNPATRDTFDRSGRLVNLALVRSSSGDYSVDETRITVTPGNSSNTISTDTNTTSSNAGTPTGDSKTKIKGDKFKQKTDTTTIKVKDNKIKIKTKD
ncbi:MAG: hypothetical protein JWQ40_4843 [Segetibacter sp.]|nr:hypothetical protein [Segetibacter sp.]